MMAIRSSLSRQLSLFGDGVNRMSAVRDILADPIDSNLCDRLFLRIADRYGND
jgi:hypothetical protein